MSQFVTVTGNDVTDVLLEATPGSTISGRIVFDGDGPAPPVRFLAIVPERADLDRTPNNVARGEIRPDLTFQMTCVDVNGQYLSPMESVSVHVDPNAPPPLCPPALCVSAAFAAVIKNQSIIVIPGRTAGPATYYCSLILRASSMPF